MSYYRSLVLKELNRVEEDRKPSPAINFLYESVVLGERGAQVY